VLIAVDLDDKAGLDAREIDNERLDDVLTAEAMAVEMMAAQMVPQRGFSPCGDAPEGAGPLSQFVRASHVFVTVLAAAPPPQPSPASGGGEFGSVAAADHSISHSAAYASPCSVNTVPARRLVRRPSRSRTTWRR